MMMKNWKVKVLSTALAMAVLVPTASYAADTLVNNQDVQNDKPFAHQQKFDPAKQQQMEDQLLSAVTKYAPEDLATWKVALDQQDQLKAQMQEKAPADKPGQQLSAEVMEQVKTIRENLKNGTITEEQATEQLKALGIEKPVRPDRADRPELSAEVKEKVDAIHEQVKAGEITQEQATEQLKALGIERPARADKADRPELSAEVKEKLDTIREQVKAGEITQEEAQAQMEELGITPHDKGLGKNDLNRQFAEAVEANDEAQIKELLPQMLQQLQERNQQMAERLADTDE